MCNKNMNRQIWNKKERLRTHHLTNSPRKKPRLDDTNVCQNDMLNRMKKRKETQDKYRLVQTPKRGNISDVANGVAP
eukprot:10821708-Heterocapsa_arctica.AAC.1